MRYKNYLRNVRPVEENDTTSERSKENSAGEDADQPISFELLRDYCDKKFAMIEQKMMLTQSKLIKS